MEEVSEVLTAEHILLEDMGRMVCGNVETGEEGLDVGEGEGLGIGVDYGGESGESGEGFLEGGGWWRECGKVVHLRGVGGDGEHI